MRTFFQHLPNVLANWADWSNRLTSHIYAFMPCNSLKNFEYEEAFSKPELLKFGKKTALP